MTTNQTIDGVSRACDALKCLTESFRHALQRGIQPSFSMGDLEFFIKTFEELRALLDAPAKAEFSIPDCPDCACVQDGQCLCIPSKPAAQPQGEPVALLSKGFTTLETGDGKYRIITQYKNRDDAWSDYTELCRAEQPAPVAVASRDESIYWLKRIDGIGQARAELIYSMGFRRHTEVPQS